MGGNAFLQSLRYGRIVPYFHLMNCLPARLSNITDSGFYRKLHAEDSYLTLPDLPWDSFVADDIIQASMHNFVSRETKIILSDPIQKPVPSWYLKKEQDES